MRPMHQVDARSMPPVMDVRRCRLKDVEQMIPAVPVDHPVGIERHVVAGLGADEVITRPVRVVLETIVEFTPRGDQFRCRHPWRTGNVGCEFFRLSAHPFFATRECDDLRVQKCFGPQSGMVDQSGKRRIRRPVVRAGTDRERLGVALPQVTAASDALHDDAVDEQNEFRPVVASDNVVPVAGADLRYERGHLSRQSRFACDADLAADPHAGRSLRELMREEVEHQPIVRPPFGEQAARAPTARRASQPDERCKTRTSQFEFSLGAGTRVQPPVIELSHEAVTPANQRCLSLCSSECYAELHLSTNGEFAAGRLGIRQIAAVPDREGGSEYFVRS